MQASVSLSLSPNDVLTLRVSDNLIQFVHASGDVMLDIEGSGPQLAKVLRDMERFSAEGKE